MDYAVINLAYRRVIVIAAGTIRAYIHNRNLAMRMEGSRTEAFAERMADILHSHSPLPEVSRNATSHDLSHYKACLQLEPIVQSLRSMQGRLSTEVHEPGLRDIWEASLSALEKMNSIKPDPLTDAVGKNGE